MPVYKIILPPEEEPEEDDIDASVAEAERKRRYHVDRGRFTGTT